MTNTSAPRTKQKPSTDVPLRQRQALTNTNTNSLNIQGGFFAMAMYRINLWTGLYMLNSYEQSIFHILFWFTFSVFVTYFLVFWSGFREGMQQASLEFSQSL